MNTHLYYYYYYYCHIDRCYNGDIHPPWLWCKYVIVSNWFEVTVPSLAETCFPVGLLILWVTTGSRIRKWIAQYRERAAVEEARQQLLVIRAVNTVHSRNRNADSDTDLTEDSDSPQRSPSSEANSCVICLINSRDIANRPCGHVCTCLNCYEAMPVPKHCPVCRSAINEIIPIYIPWKRNKF